MFSYSSWGGNPGVPLSDAKGGTRLTSTGHRESTVSGGTYFVIDGPAVEGMKTSKEPGDYWVPWPKGDNSVLNREKVGDSLTGNLPTPPVPLPRRSDGLWKEIRNKRDEIVTHPNDLKNTGQRYSTGNKCSKKEESEGGEGMRMTRT